MPLALGRAVAHTRTHSAATMLQQQASRTPRTPQQQPRTASSLRRTSTTTTTTATPAAARRRALLSVRAAALPSVDGVTAAYVALGLGAASFVATVGVAPRFREAFKEDVAW